MTSSLLFTLLGLNTLNLSTGILFLAWSTLGILFLSSSLLLVGKVTALNLGERIFLGAMFSDDIMFDDPSPAFGPQIPLFVPAVLRS